MDKNKKICIVLMADSSTHENEGRALHALLFAQQAHEADSEVKLFFDGGGVEWAEKLPEHKELSELYQDLVEKDIIGGVCSFCSGAFGVKDELELAGAKMLDEANGHPNIGKRVAEGWTPMIL
jgi:hypothetical protein